MDIFARTPSVCVNSNVRNYHLQLQMQHLHDIHSAIMRSGKCFLLSAFESILPTLLTYIRTCFLVFIEYKRDVSDPKDADLYLIKTRPEKTLEIFVNI